MKLVLFLYAGPGGDRLHRVAETLGLPAHTDLGVIHGTGQSGRHEGSRAFPGDGHAMFAIIDDAKAAALLPDLKRCRDELPVNERLHAFILPVEQLL